MGVVSCTYTMFDGILGRQHGPSARYKLDGRSFGCLEGSRKAGLDEQYQAVGSLGLVFRVVHSHAVDELGLERPDAGLKLQKAAPVGDKMGGK